MLKTKSSRKNQSPVLILDEIDEMEEENMEPAEISQPGLQISSAEKCDHIGDSHDSIYIASPLSEEQLHFKCVELHVVLAGIARDNSSFKEIQSFLSQNPEKYRRF